MDGAKINIRGKLLKIAKILIKAGANVNLKGKKRRPILIEVDNPELLKLLIKAGANVNEKWTPPIGSDIDTPLSTAIRDNNISKVKLLIKAGANPNLAGTTNITPLMCAAMYGRHDAVQMLLAAGAKKDVTDDKGNTAYTYAAKFPAIAQMLAPQTAPQAQPSNASVDEDYNLMEQ